MLSEHPLCQSRKSLQTGRSGSEEFPCAAGDDEERSRDTGPLSPDQRCADLAERQTCPFDWTYIHIYLNTFFSSDLPQTKALPCGARVTSSPLLQRRVQRDNLIGPHSGPKSHFVPRALPQLALALALLHRSHSCVSYDIYLSIRCPHTSTMPVWSSCANFKCPELLSAEL
jgi:hypothetical protein